MTFWHYLSKDEPKLFSQTYINILTHFTNLVHCPQIHLPIFKVVDKILAAVWPQKPQQKVRKKINRKQLQVWLSVIFQIFRQNGEIEIRDHPVKTSAYFHNFWPLPPYYQHSSTMIMKGIFTPYVLWSFDHWHMGTTLPPPKTRWRLKWMVPKDIINLSPHYTLI